VIVLIGQSLGNNETQYNRFVGIACNSFSLVVFNVIFMLYPSGWVVLFPTCKQFQN
jgi:hypothetical protein